MRIIELHNLEEKRRYLPLLLDTDPSEEMVMRYLPRARVFLLEREHRNRSTCVSERRALGIVAVVDLETGKCEIKNLAVVSTARRLGYGRALVEHVADVFSEDCVEMLVGTSEACLSFYENCGFTYSHRVPRFFEEHYPHPMPREGGEGKDMVYLRRMLRPSPLLSLYCMHQSRFLHPTNG